jgi:hypothetical protein
LAEKRNIVSGAESEKTALDIKQIGLRLWSKRKTVLAGACLGLVIGAIALHFMNFKYTSYALMRANEDQSSGGRGGVLGGLSALSGIAGMLGMSGQGDFDAFNALIGSDTLAREMAARHPDLLPTLFPGQWDAKTHSWVHRGVMAGVKDGVRTILGLPAWKPPGVEELRLYTEHNVTVGSDFKTKLLTISYSDKNPVFARDFIRWIYTDADRLVRDSARDRARARIAYLESVLPTVTLSETRQSFTELLTTEQQRMMMVQADQYFTVVVIKPPLVASEPSSPVPIEIIAGFAAAGAVLGGLWGLFGMPLFAVGARRVRVSRVRQPESVLG